MNHITVLFFATLRDRAGMKSLNLDMPDDAAIQDLKNHLVRAYPSLAPSMDTVVIAINREFAFDETIIPPQAEVAMFPPVSGGR